MAHSSNKSLGDLSGKLGKTVIYDMFGQTVARSMPTRTKKRLSVEWASNMSAFKMVFRLMQSVKPFIRIGFSGYTDTHSAFHEALSINLKQDIFNPDEGEQADYSRCIFSRGELPGADTVGAERIDQNKIRVTWNSDPGDTGRPTDRVMLLFYSHARNESLISLDAGSRSEGNAILEVPSHLADQTLEGFISFVNPVIMMTGDKRLGISESRYIGQIVK